MSSSGGNSKSVAAFFVASFAGGTIKGTEKDVVERSQVNRGQGVEGVDRLGGHNLGPRAFRSGSVHLEAQNNLGPGEVRSGHVLLEA